MITIVSLYVEPKPGNEPHGERPFWAWEDEGWKYVRRFWEGVRRHVAPAWRGVMLTDAPHRFRNFHASVEIVPLRLPGNGWWSKLEAFRPDVARGRTWYSDLDNVLLGRVDEYLALPLTANAPMVMLEDRYYENMANGSNLLFEAGHPALAGLWREYAQAPRAAEIEFSQWPHASDQAFVANRLRGQGYAVPYAQGALPEGYFLSGRDELEHGAEWSQCRMIFGAGDPKPHASAHPAYHEWREVA